MLLTSQITMYLIYPETMNNDDACNNLLHLIETLETSRETQMAVDTRYNDLLNCLYTEMDRYLPKYGTNTRKSLRVKKPYWNAHLMGLWKEMCQKETEFLKFRGPYHIKQFLRGRFKESSKTFHRALRKAERDYNKTVQIERRLSAGRSPEPYMSADTQSPAQKGQITL